MLAVTPHARRFARQLATRPLLTFPEATWAVLMAALALRWSTTWTAWASVAIFVAVLAAAAAIYAAVPAWDRRRAGTYPRLLALLAETGFTPRPCPPGCPAPPGHEHMAADACTCTI